VAEALRLAHVHEGGSVAVIAVNRRPLVREFRRSGFTMAGPESRTLTRNGRSVSVLDAEEARGLEFDAVVVVEPAEFPKNLGRHGLLYTSLTRANRQLAVVHALPLPDALRRHARR
jgi:superfamily I DNA/RNA helicase